MLGVKTCELNLEQHLFVIPNVFWSKDAVKAELIRTEGDVAAGRALQVGLCCFNSFQTSQPYMHRCAHTHMPRSKWLRASWMLQLIRMKLWAKRTARRNILKKMSQWKAQKKSVQPCICLWLYVCIYLNIVSIQHPPWRAMTFIEWPPRFYLCLPMLFITFHPCARMKIGADLASVRPSDLRGLVGWCGLENVSKPYDQKQ